LKGLTYTEEVWDRTVHHIDELAFKPETEMPHVYGRFKDKVWDRKIRGLIPEPKKG